MLKPSYGFIQVTWFYSNFGQNVISCRYRKLISHLNGHGQMNFKVFKVAGVDLMYHGRSSLAQPFYGSKIYTHVPIMGKNKLL